MKAVRLGLETNLRQGVLEIETAASKALQFTEDFKEGPRHSWRKGRLNSKAANRTYASCGIV
jgi:hypothetical protein